MGIFRNFVYFYRIIGYKSKTSWLTCILPMILAYSLGTRFNLFLIVVNSIIVFAVLMTLFTFNDYVDMEKDENYLGLLVDSRRISKRSSLILCFIPLVSLFLVPLLGCTSIILLSLFLVLGLLYSLPKVMLKSRRAGWTVNSIMAVVLFVESFYVVSSIWTLTTFGMMIILVLFHMYTEQIHQSVEGKPHYRLQFFPGIALLLSLILMALNPVFILAAIFSTARILSISKTDNKELSVLRGSAPKQALSTTYSAYEFGIYAVLAILGFI